ncbi:MAG TPA: DinB family protein [Candidatus Krumholzibacteria bacterium]|nr:DinB family protein [Candidatus Krumholzibacteria bacterium]
MQAMSQWLVRTFAYAPPAGEYPAIVERLRGTPARVEAAVRYVPEPILTARAGDAWSAQENIGHLLDLEPLWLARAREILAGAKELSAADMSNGRTYAAGHNARSVVAIGAELRVARNNLVALLDGVTDADVSRGALHPRLRRPMRLIDLCFFVAEHDDHHLAIVTRLLAGATR